MCCGLRQGAGTDRVAEANVARDGREPKYCMPYEKGTNGSNKITCRHPAKTETYKKYTTTIQS
ncbi:hypothetical protein SXCC_00510 [Gluconacetobacter sp. SXCC-1]|nr:hypothetical protein SXCC_00510 [Gluconacetobacter sp. SXCC-1]